MDIDMWASCSDVAKYFGKLTGTKDNAGDPETAKLALGYPSSISSAGSTPHKSQMASAGLGPMRRRQT